MALQCGTPTTIFCQMAQTEDDNGLISSRVPVASLSEGVEQRRKSGRTHRLSPRLTKDPIAVQKLKKLLLLLRHASSCSQESSSSSSCGVSHCGSMRHLLNHAMQCAKKTGGGGSGETGSNCQYPHCNRSKFALWHFKHCGDGASCPVCGPVRDIIAYEESHGVSGQYLEQNPRRRITKRARVDSLTPVSEEREGMDQMAQASCEELLRRLLDHSHGWVFSSPVDPELLNVPDYFDVIKHPMDLGTIKDRLRAREHYKSIDTFRADVLLTFDNAIQYNEKGSEVYEMANEMKHYFLQLCATSF